MSNDGKTHVVTDKGQKETFCKLARIPQWGVEPPKVLVYGDTKFAKQWKDAGALQCSRCKPDVERLDEAEARRVAKEKAAAKAEEAEKRHAQTEAEKAAKLAESSGGRIRAKTIDTATPASTPTAPAKARPVIHDMFDESED